MIRSLMCTVGFWVFQTMEEVDGKHVLAEAIIGVLRNCSNKERAHACKCLKSMVQNVSRWQDVRLRQFTDECFKVLYSLNVQQVDVSMSWGEHREYQKIVVKTRTAWSSVWVRLRVSDGQESEGRIEDSQVIYEPPQ